jgi:molecular chaperone GrpE
VNLKEQQNIKSQGGVEKIQEGEQKLPADMESPSQAQGDEVQKEQDFDPETAGKDDLLAKYRELQDELTAAEERVLRTAADAENYKKRLQREQEEQTRYANEAIMRDLLPVVDNLERALDHSKAGPDQGSMVEGLNLTLKGFLDSLAKFGCTPVEAVGKIFDPNFHEAVSQEESSDHEINEVIRELQKGYLLKDRLLRPAMVVISKAANHGGDTTQEQAEGGNDKTETRKVRIKVKNG